MLSDKKGLNHQSLTEKYYKRKYHNKWLALGGKEKAPT